MKDIKYQQDTLTALRQYLSLARTSAPRAAFEAATAGLPAALRREYISLSDAVADAPYVFCSVATVHSKIEVEQILGRVLRMPYAERRLQPALNRAYAHVSSRSWPYAVQQMRDRLVDMGFDEIEAEEAIREQRPKPLPQLGLQYPTTDSIAGLPLFSLTVRESPDLTILEPE